MPQRAESLENRAKRRRETSANRGYDYRWQRARAAWLTEHPLCNICWQAEQTTAATVVDHVIPHRGDERLFWDPNNWQSLCKTCHDAKTRRGE